MDGTPKLEPLLAEPRSYCRAIAAEYEDHAIPGARGGELSRPRFPKLDRPVQRHAFVFAGEELLD